jgi:hypothetical protein
VLPIVPSSSSAVSMQVQETERQRDGETERQRDRETERQRDRETEREGGGDSLVNGGWGGGHACGAVCDTRLREPLGLWRHPCNAECEGGRKGGKRSE